MEKEQILNFSRDLGKLSSIRKSLKEPDGGIYEGTLPKQSWSNLNLGDTKEKVILASKGVEKLKLEDYTVMGGWCAVRTRCMNEISQGNIVDARTAKSKTYSSPSEVADWALNAVSLDQIVEAIGIYNGSNYFAISEVKLWSDKLINTISRYLNRKLLRSEENKLYESIFNADQARYKITEKYISYITNKKVNLTRAVDADILDDLIKGRDYLFDVLNISIDSLSKTILNNRVNFKNKNLSKAEELDVVNDINQYVDDYSLVWYMYTGGYFNILKDKGYIKTKRGLIIEPWSHAASNEAEAEFNFKVFAVNKGVNNYLRSNGINEDLAFIGIDEVSEFNFKKIKITKTIGEVPNTLNYKEYLKKLESDPNISSLELRNNPVFMNATNYLPYGRSLEIIKEMIDIQKDFRNKKKFDNLGNSQEEIRGNVSNLRDNYSAIIKSKAHELINELYHMFNFVFS